MIFYRLNPLNVNLWNNKAQKISWRGRQKGPIAGRGSVEPTSQLGKCTVYRIIKTSFGFESYLNELSDLLRKYFTKFRCRNHCLLIEAGVRSQVLCDMRIWQFCETDMGDKFHYLLCCPNFKEECEHFINSKYYVRPSTFYLHELFKQTKGKNLKKLAIFV